MGVRTKKAAAPAPTTHTQADIFFFSCGACGCFIVGWRAVGGVYGAGTGIDMCQW
jgi:hypothetical protein